MSDFLNYLTIGQTILIGDNSTQPGNAIKTGAQLPSSLSIPSNIQNIPVTAIGQYAFRYVTNFKTISIPTSIKEIHYMAFDWGETAFDLIDLPNIEFLASYSLSSNFIKELRLGPKIQFIGIYPLPNNPTLMKIIVDKENEYYSNDFQYCLYDKKQTRLIQVPMGKSRIIIPETVVEITTKAFEYSKITEIIIPEKCNKIAALAFRRCKSLSIMVIYSSLQQSSAGCFSELNNLTTVYYMNNKIISKALFATCSSLSQMIVCYFYPRQQVAGINVTETIGYCPYPQRITLINQFNFHIFNLLSHLFIILTLK